MSKTVFTTKNLIKAYLNCRETKRHTINALKYELDVDRNLDLLRRSLANRTYRPGRSICFVVTFPKPREIFAAEFGDRIVHHVLINEVEDIWEKGIFIEDSYACRAKKGTHFGMHRLSQFVSAFAYYGQFDVSNFFPSINKNILYRCFSKVILRQNRPDFWKEEVLWIARVIIFNDPTKKYFYKGDPDLKKLVPLGKSLFDHDKITGMPIGNLTSQFLANVYLNELDHFVKDELGCVAYGRYVDDFLLFSNSKEEIIAWRDKIFAFLKNNLRLTANPRKQQIQPTRHGVPFVGYFIKPWGVTVRRNVVKNIKKKLYTYNNSVDIEHTVRSVNSYFGHFAHAKSARLRRHLVSEHMCLGLKTKIVVVGNYHHLGVRKLKNKEHKLYE
jgi:hypothetical protein